MNIADIINGHCDALLSRDGAKAAHFETLLRKLAAQSGATDPKAYSAWWMKQFAEHRPSTYFQSRLTNAASPLAPAALPKLDLPAKAAIIGAVVAGVGLTVGFALALHPWKARVAKPISNQDAGAVR